MHESGLALFKRGTLRKKKAAPVAAADGPKSGGCLGNIGPGPKDAWYIYCYLATCWVPAFMLNACGECLSSGSMQRFMAPSLCWNTFLGRHSSCGPVREAMKSMEARKLFSGRFLRSRLVTHVYTASRLRDLASTIACEQWMR